MVDRVQMNVRVGAKLKAAVDRAADHYECSQGELIERALRAYIPAEIMSPGQMALPGTDEARQISRLMVARKEAGDRRDSVWLDEIDAALARLGVTLG